MEAELQLLYEWRKKAMGGEESTASWRRDGEGGEALVQVGVVAVVVADSCVAIAGEVVATG